MEKRKIKCQHCKKLNQRIICDDCREKYSNMPSCGNLDCPLKDFHEH